MEEERKAANFIEAEINKDIENHVYANDRVLTRFPPEPNGYLHIGHVKSICLNFGIGQKYHGETNVRFDDTNPAKEEVEYVNSILEDVKWLGFHWKEPVHYASDYFPQLYEFACKLIRMGLAYVDDQTSEEIHDTRGDLKHPGKESPYRNRSVEENLKLFQEMKEGKYKDGEKVLRAKIDMASPNMVMRDPVIYRVLHATHHRTGDTWCIYPLYDFAHPLSDAIEGITHSICTLEFEERRPLYNWCLQAFDGPERPRQIEFARLNVTTMITSMSTIIMTMKTMSIIMTMTTKTMTMSMMKTVPVAAMSMSTITIIMQMMYLPAGARRHRTNSSVQNLRKYLRSLSILTISSAPKVWWRVPMAPGCTLIWFRASMRSVRVSRITPDVSW